MSLMIWDDSISVHIPHIDEQHKMLIGWINSLSEAIDNGEGEQAVLAVLQKLIEYVADHFAQEEQFMLSCEFPGLNSHRKEHDYFVQKLNDIRCEFLDGAAMGRTTYVFLVDWLICHIKGTDQKYSRYFLQQHIRTDEN